MGKATTAAHDVIEGEDNVKRLRVIKGSPLIGCPGKRVTPGETVIEVKPSEDGYVTVQTVDEKQGSLPISCIG